MRAPVALRQDMRRLRRTIGASEAAARAISAAEQFRHLLPALAHAAQPDVAIYEPMEGELDPRPLRALIEALDGRMLLPVCVAEALRFAPFDESTPMAPNRYGIDEPLSSSTVGGADLDLVIVPLVAFDRRGNRLGMGAGFYDRSFARAADEFGSRRTTLVGYGHDEQEVDALEPDEWDIAMDAIVTPTRAWMTTDE